MFYVVKCLINMLPALIWLLLSPQKWLHTCNYLYNRRYLWQTGDLKKTDWWFVMTQSINKFELYKLSLYLRLLSAERLSSCCILFVWQVLRPYLEVLYISASSSKKTIKLIESVYKNRNIYLAGLFFWFLIKEKKSASQYWNLITNLKIFDNIHEDIKYIFLFLRNLSENRVKTLKIF